MSHLLNVPFIDELESMVEFCRKFNNIYIYGCNKNQQYLLKFLDCCELSIKGYITTELVPEPDWIYRALPIRLIDDVIKDHDTGIILASRDLDYNSVVPKMNSNGFTNYFFLSERNKQQIVDKMSMRSMPGFEINLAEHCNLNCRHCDHFSQLAEPEFLDLDTFSRDMQRLAELSDGRLGWLSLLGGEPLLHEDVNKFMEVARAHFPKVVIYIYTNGLLLLAAEKNKKGNFWECCAKNDITVIVTRHTIDLDLASIEAKAQEYSVKLKVITYLMTLTKDEKHYAKYPLDTSGTIKKHEFIYCTHFNCCFTLRKGRIYTCVVIPNSRHFNKAFNKNLQETEADSIDIYKVESYEEVTSFLSNRIPFCKYCDIKSRTYGHKWAKSDKSIDEYTR